MALTYDELQDLIYRAYREVYAEHELYVPQTNLGPGVLNRIEPGHFEWTFAFDIGSHLTIEQMEKLATDMHDALANTLQGTGVQVEPPIVEPSSYTYRIPLRAIAD